MGVLDYVIGILLLIVCLGILITLHELGHFLTAKLFNVYCLEFSIGFGPAIFTRRPKEGKETKFSIRCIPLGGYVAMYGEDTDEKEAQNEELIDVPKERNLEYIAKWKRAIISVAGVTVNCILGFLFIMLSCCCFPDVRPEYRFYSNENYSGIVFKSNVEENSKAATAGIKTGDELVFTYFAYGENSELIIVDDDIEIPTPSGEIEKFILGVNPLYTTTKDPVFSESLMLVYQSEETKEIKNGSEVIRSIHLPDLEKGTRAIGLGDIITFDILTEDKISHNITLNAVESGKDAVLENVGISFPLVSTYRSFGDSMALTWQKFCDANTAIVRALIGLFKPGGINNLGGVVAMAKQITAVNYNYGFGTILFYAGFISCNLAIFNLIPFPGLDGWALLVIAIEAISRKKVPQKVKAIVSFAGLALLFGLMIFITIKDIFGIVF